MASSRRRGSAHQTDQNGLAVNGTQQADPWPTTGLKDQPFSVAEALPRTPLTSMVPFYSGILPVPSIGAAFPAPALTDIVSSQEFDALNREAAHHQPTSQQLQQTMAQVQHLLKRGSTTKFKFKTGPGIASNKSTNAPEASLSAGLLPFTRMVHENTAVPFRYPTPETPSAISPRPVSASLDTAPSPLPRPQPRQQPQRTPSQTPPAPSLAQHVNANQKAYSQNATIEVALPSKSRPESAAARPPTKTPPSAQARGTPQAPSPQLQQATPGQPTASLASPSQQNAVATSTADPLHQPDSSQNKLLVELPRAPSFNKNEFLVIPDHLEEPSNMFSRKRKLEELDPDGDGVYGQTVDNRQKANAAYNELQSFLQTAFHAEDRAVSRQSGDDTIDLLASAENQATLTTSAQARAQTLINKTISMKCYDRVPLDRLLRLHDLGDGALRYAVGLDIAVQVSWEESDVEQWLQLLPALERGIKAARTSLRMMCGGRQDKQLYSQDSIERSLTLVKQIAEGIILPVAELRDKDRTSLFKVLSSRKKYLASLFSESQKLFSLMSELVSKIDVSEVVSSTLESVASQLVFMENANAEKSSVLDTARFDGLRLVAMDMLSQIFLVNVEQRRGIFTEILMKLEKLPTGKRGARTFRLTDGTNIQPVSALIMRLVQTSAGKSESARAHSAALPSIQNDDNEDEEEEPISRPVRNGIIFRIQDEHSAAKQHGLACQELEVVAQGLIGAATDDASYVIQFMISRAMNSTKSGESPYRNLLDLFVEDFTACLDNPDWPAAELLLRLLMNLMVGFVKDPKRTTTAKNMALEMLGTMGAAISKLRGHVRKTVSALDARDTNDLGVFLSDLAGAALERKSRPEQMVSWAGPFRVTLEFLERRHLQDPHLGSAISYLVSTWAFKICEGYEAYKDSEIERDKELGRLAYRLREMIQDRRWLSSEFSFKEVMPSQARLSYATTLLRSNLCEAFSEILNILVGSISSDQPTVRSKSLKSINQVLETDPSILDGDSVMVPLILQCCNDLSPQVRDSALGLIGKCISMRPALENKMTGKVMERFSDNGPGVRKRAMKLAKDIYIRNHNRAVRSAIAGGLLHRIRDPEESVRDLAQQMMEEIWFSPAQFGSDESAANQTELADHIALMVQTVKLGTAADVLVKVLQTILSTKSKTAKASSGVCAKFVVHMFDLIDNQESQDAATPSGREVLQVLMFFAKADASLFTYEQLRLLKPHITGLATSDDFAVSRAVVVIFRRVLPQLSSAHSQFLADIRKELMPACKKISRAVLDDVMACLWIISTLLGVSEHLARICLSSLKAIRSLHVLSQQQPLDERQIRQFDRYALIVGMTGKHCNIESHLPLFKAEFPQFKGSTVSKLMVDTIIPFAVSARMLELRKAALDAVGLVCQSSPRNYVSPNVYTKFQEVFDEQNPVLEDVILRSFFEFLLSEEKRSDPDEEPVLGIGAEPEKKRELTVIGGTNFDDVASATTHRFLPEITRIAMATEDEHAFLAAEVLASINRQGLVHPKETGVTFITLETSSHPRISELAFIEHKALHGKHETVVEREYVKAMQSAFAYQRDIAKDPHGAIVGAEHGSTTFTPKLHLMLEVLKISRSKNRLRFLEKMCVQCDFELAKLDMKASDSGERLPQHVQYARFIMENLAFMDFITVRELQATIAKIEKLVTTTGANVAQAIESDVFQLRMDAIEQNSNPDPNAMEVDVPAPTAQPDAMDVDVTSQGQGGPSDTAPTPSIYDKVDADRLRQLAAASIVLYSLWEVRTYLRRQWGVAAERHRGRESTGGGGKATGAAAGGGNGGGKGQAKDLSAKPNRLQSVTGDHVWAELGQTFTGLMSRERMIETCHKFVELMNVDKEFVIHHNDDDNLDGGENGPATASGDDDGGDDDTDGQHAHPQAAGRGRKRRGAGSTTPGAGRGRRRASSMSRGTPKRRGRPSKNAGGATGSGGGGGGGKRASVDWDAEGDFEDDF